jgi:hypothetical protein
MKRRHRLTLDWNHLEDRALLSVAHFQSAGVVHIDRAAAIQSTGTIRGTFQPAPDGTDLAAMGSGTLSHVGPVSANAVATHMMGSTGFSGTVHLSNNSGTVDLTFDGSGTKVLKTKFAVQHGTGAYTNVQGGGTGSIQFTNNGMGGGTFTMKVRLKVTGV